MNPTSHSRGPTPSWYLFLVLVLVALLTTAGTCANAELEGDQDHASGPDKIREGASEVSLNATIIDSVDPEKGDTNDWKYFTVPAPGVIKVLVTFDNPKAQGEVVLRDSRGKSVSTYQDARRNVLDHITYKAEPGPYYLHIWANESDSDYTLVVEYNSL